MASLPWAYRHEGVQCVIEEISAMSINGWAVSGRMQTASVELCCAGRLLPATVRRVVRDDVLLQLGHSAPSAPALGFRLELPAELWDLPLPDGSVDFYLRVESDDSGMPMMRVGGDQLDAWFESILAMTDPDQRTGAWQRAQTHLQRRLAPDRWALAEQRWAAADTAHRAQAALLAARLKWAVEKIETLHVTGWLLATDGGQEQFSVVCGGQSFLASAMRYERADVVATLGAHVRPDTGFEVELPAALWAAIPPGRTGTVQVVVNEQPLLRQALTLARPALAALVAEERANETTRSAADRAEHQYRARLLLEHVIAAELLAQLPEEDANFVRELARREGQQARLPGAALRDEDSAPASPVDAAIWQLQRNFSAALERAGEAADPMAALDASLLLADETCPAQAIDRFFVSMVPLFCAADRLPALRDRLDARELRALAMARHRWELSLVLPVAVLDELADGKGRLADSASVMERLADATDAGWLNTAAVLDALRRLDAALRQAPVDDLELDSFIAASLRLFGAIGDRHDSRLYDHHLVLALAHLIRLAPHAAETAPGDCAQAALKHYGLTPVFWTALHQLLPDTADWPPLLRQGQAQFERLAQALDALSRGECAAGATCAEALAALRELGCADIDPVQRHVLLTVAASAPTGDPLSLAGSTCLQPLPDADILRWVGRLPEALDPQHAAKIDPLLRQLSPVSLPANPALRQAADTALAALRAALRSGDRPALEPAWQQAQAACLALTGERNGFVGLTLLARCAQCLDAAIGPAAMPQLAAQALESLCQATTRALLAAERNRQRWPSPPAPALAALSWLSHSAALRDEAVLRVALATGAETLLRRWHIDLLQPSFALPETPLIGVDTPGVGWLVVVRARPDSGAQLDRIGQSWGLALARQGIPWVVWHQQPGPVAPRSSPASPATPEVRAPTLLGLLEWLIGHSDFGHAMLLEDDAHLDVTAWLAGSAAASHHYHGLPMERADAPNGAALGSAPLGSHFASIADGLSISRHAARQALAQASTATGARLLRSASREEASLGDLLARAGVPLADEGHAVHQRRPPQPGFRPQAFHNFYLPGPGLPTVLTHVMPEELDARTGLAPFVNPPGKRLLPRRLWPTDCVPRLANDGSGHQLVELSAPAKADALQTAGCMVVAVARNERVLAPHFLAHYRQLGVRHFAIVDNLSDDGTREYLLAQDDVVVYGADTPYRLSRYGVSWQQAVLAAHAHHRWALVADMDEFLVWPGCESESLPALCQRLGQQGADAARVLMVDMYPQGRLDDADLQVTPPFQAAPCFDARPVLRWRLGSGSYSSGPTWVSGLRHRLMPDSAPNHYTSQKIALLCHRPWVRFSEGLHYASGLTVAPVTLAFAHFKYHSGFRAKVLAEVARGQHYNNAEEYRKYQELLAEARSSFFDPEHSLRYENSQSFASFLA